MSTLTRCGRVLVGLGIVFAAVGGAVLCPVASAVAGEVAGPGWEITSSTFPTNLEPGGKGAILVQPLNVGAAASSGPIAIEDVLPRGVTATKAGSGASEGGTFAVAPESTINSTYWECAIAPGSEENSIVSCHNSSQLPSLPGGGGLPVDNSEGIANGTYQPGLGIAVDVAADAEEGSHLNRMVISGGGALSAVRASDPVGVGSSAAPFGLARWNGWYSNANGTPDTQAGSVPYAFTVSFDLATVIEKGASEVRLAGSEARDFEVALPPGFVGDPQATPQCTRVQFDTEHCPTDSLVGTVEIDVAPGYDLHRLIYNVVPPAGLPAEFAFTFESISAFIQPSLRTGGDYGITTRTNDIPQRIVIGSTVTLWGVPADPSHDPWRCGSTGGCKLGGGRELGSHPVLKPFLRMPTSCGSPAGLSGSVNGWLPGFAAFTDPLSFFTDNAEGQPVGLAGCGALPFTPSVEARPTTGISDSATGLDFDLHVPQPQVVSAVEANVGGEQQTVGAAPGLHEADLKDSTVTFPTGLVVDSSSADGLGACSEAQIGFTGFKELNAGSEPGVKTVQFTPGAAQCPDASKVGTVEVDTPLIPHPLLGAIYLAEQSENPFGSLLALYITVYDPTTGVVVKLPGLVEANPQTGQLTVSVPNTPQVPFEDFKIALFSGTRAALRTPATCGTFTTGAQLTPWSTPGGGAVAQPSGSFEVSEAPGGGPCPTSAADLPNDPGFSAGAFTPIAGAYSPFVLHLTREDGTQPLEALDVTLPEGLLGKIAGVAQCSQAGIEAAQRRSGLSEGRLETQAPSCPAASEVGVAHVGVGAGAPLYVTGHAYLAGPYRGAPFSIVVISPAVAGPFDLGVVVVRTALFINPVTAQVSVQSDPFPTILDGIPLDIRSIAVEITRSEFTLNPTSCEKMQVTGVSVGESTQAAISSPFQVGGCTGLAFKPAFAAASQGKTSRADGASLQVRVTARPGDANVAKVAVQIPALLPSRLSTLQKACTEARFDANPASCPAASDVATATVHTPILNVPLSGPVYFVSHGGAAFPDLEMVLQGEGVTIVLTGNTEIKGGVTYSKFQAIPDAPFSTFELDAPQGPYSILASNLPASAKYSLCGQNLTMPTTLTGQNGVVLHQNTKITITGCTKTKRASTLTRKQKLAKALKACQKKKNKHQRRDCQAQAHKRYGPTTEHKQTKKKR